MLFFAFSRKQAIIADSSTSAEFIGTHKACQQIGWTQNLLSEMGVPISSPTVVYQDNMSTIKLIAHKGISIYDTILFENFYNKNVLWSDTYPLGP